MSFKQQFATSPDLNTELVNAIMSALDAHNAMSTQALEVPNVCQFRHPGSRSVYMRLRGFPPWG
jgi:hypothetical protein